MNKEELESFFSYINYVEDRIDEINDMELYEYVVNCITNNEYCTIEGYEEQTKEMER